MRVDGFTSLADNRICSEIGELQIDLTGVLEHGEFNTVTHGIPVRPHKFSDRSIHYTRGIPPKIMEMIYEESDQSIVPKKLVTTVEGRD